MYFLFFLFLPNGKSEAKMTNTETETDIWLLTFCMYTYMVLRIQCEHINIEQTVQLLLPFLTSELYRSVEMIPVFFKIKCKFVGTTSNTPLNMIMISV